MKVKFFILAVIFIFMTGCSNESNIDAGNSDEEIVDDEVSIETFDTMYGEVYRLAIEELLTVDEGLNDDIEYIAIDVDTFEGATLQDINYIFGYFSKYNEEVIDESFESLDEKGMVGEMNTLAGILISVENIREYSNGDIGVEIMKFRSGIGAIGMGYKIGIVEGEWKIIESLFLWIS